MDAGTEKGNTPIADAFANNRAVMADAMALIRKLETDRARLLGYLLAHAPEYASIALRTEYQLDRVELP